MVTIACSAVACAVAIYGHTILGDRADFLYNRKKAEVSARGSELMVEVAEKDVGESRATLPAEVRPPLTITIRPSDVRPQKVDDRPEIDKQFGKFYEALKPLR